MITTIKVLSRHDWCLSNKLLNLGELLREARHTDRSTELASTIEVLLEACGTSFCPEFCSYAIFACLTNLCRGSRCQRSARNGINALVAVEWGVHSVKDVKDDRGATPSRNARRSTDCWRFWNEILQHNNMDIKEVLEADGHSWILADNRRQQWKAIDDRSYYRLGFNYKDLDEEEIEPAYGLFPKKRPGTDGGKWWG